MIKLNKKCEFVIDQLENSGFEAFAVGGCVRNALMQIETSDYDITTSALPDETKKVFSEFTVVETGIKHGTVTVIIDKTPFEITTYRQENGYSDNRRPDEVTFVNDIKLDLSRRDFTVNAIAFSPKKGLIDPFFGVEDIKKRVIRAVGEPKKRFSEDSLRIIRALRFASTLGFEIENETAKSINELAKTLKNVSPERLYSELKKLINGDFAKPIIENFKDAISNVFDVNEDISKLDKLPKDHSMRLAYVCNNVSKTLDCLKADNETKRLAKLFSASSPIPNDTYLLKRQIATIGREDYQKVAVFRRALYYEDEMLNVERLVNECNCLSVSELELNGNDLKGLGLNGKEIGKTLDLLLDKVLKEEIDNKKELLLAAAKDIDI